MRNLMKNKTKRAMYIVAAITMIAIMLMGNLQVFADVADSLGTIKDNVLDQTESIFLDVAVPILIAIIVIVLLVLLAVQGISYINEKSTSNKMWIAIILLIVGLIILGGADIAFHALIGAPAE